MERFKHRIREITRRAKGVSLKTTIAELASYMRGWRSNTAGSGLGPWYLARAKALSVGLSNAYFKSLGLPTFIDGC